MNFRPTDTVPYDLRKSQRTVFARASYVKITTLLLLNKGLSIPETSEYLGIDDSTASTRELYERVLVASQDTKMVYFISDKAHYYKNQVLAEWESTAKILPVFLPPYSLNLNLTEGLRKFPRKKIINTCFFRKKEEFQRAVIQLFEDIPGYRKELVRLKTLNFNVLHSQSTFYRVYIS